MTLVESGRDTIAIPAPFPELLDPGNCPLDDDGGLSCRTTTHSALESNSRAPACIETGTDVLTIGLIDRYQFSRECLKKAIEDLHPHIRISAFALIERCIAEQQGGFDLIIYHWRSNDVSDAEIVSKVDTICRAFSGTRLIVLSDADDAQQRKTIRSLLKSGAHGFIPTQTTGIQVAVAAIGFVKAGG